MISVIIPVRNTRDLTCQCLESVLFTFANDKFGEVEYILIDDNSSEECGIIDVFLEFREQTSSNVKIIHFLERSQYTAAFSYGLAQATGGQILFLSNDMMVTPAYVRTLLGVAALEKNIGVVRGTSQYVDCFPEYCYQPPFSLRGYRDILSFSDFVAEYYGLQAAVDEFLTGDSVLIKREVLDKIGVMDMRFFGYFSDIDYGLRVQRAGFKLVCAKGAWLYHEGAGSHKEEAAAKDVDYAVIHEARMNEVNNAYQNFRLKWDMSLPEMYSGVKSIIDFNKLRMNQELGFAEYESPSALNLEICEFF